MFGDAEGEEIDSTTCKLEFCGIEHAAGFGALGQEIADPVKIVLNIVIPEDRVVVTVFIVLHLTNYEVQVLRVAIP